MKTFFANAAYRGYLHLMTGGATSGRKVSHLSSMLHGIKAAEAGNVKTLKNTDRAEQSHLYGQDVILKKTEPQKEK